jgi:hypothetical protein
MEKLVIGTRNLQSISGAYYICVPKVFILNNNLKKQDKIEFALESKNQLILRKK